MRGREPRIVTPPRGRDPNVGEFWNGGKHLVADTRKGEGRPLGGEHLAFGIGGLI